MSLKPSSPDLANNPAQPGTAAVGEDTLYFGRVLRHFVEVGDELVGMLHQEARLVAKAQAELAEGTFDPQTAPIQAPQSDILGAYQDITRSVRRSIMLYQKLFAAKKTPSAQHRISARRKIIRDVEDAIQANAEPDKEEKLHAELLERLDRPDFDIDIANQSIADIVTDICRDLGITGLYDSAPWKRRTPHDIAILNARAAKLAGEALSAEIEALIAAAPPPPPKRRTPLTAAEVSKMSDEEIERRLAAIRRYGDP
jgi:hypothetical protein